MLTRNKDFGRKSDPKDVVLTWFLRGENEMRSASALGQGGRISLRAVLLESEASVLARMLTRFLREDARASNTFIEYFLSALYSHLLDRYCTSEEKRSVSIGGLSPRNRRRVETLLSGADGYQVSLESLATVCGLSERHFARAFQQTFGIPLHQLQLDMRIREAIHLLTRTNEALKDVALQLGYSDQATFTESFTRELGVPPGRYRRQFYSA